MWKRATAIAMLTASTLSCTIWNKPARGWSGATGGEQIEKLFWDDVKEKNGKSIDQHVASTFAGYGNGGTLDRAAFVQQLQSYRLTAVSLSDCRSQLNGADVVITCTVRRQGTLDGQPLAPAISSLSVWQQAKKGWIMIAHSEAPLP
jgi:hypothetical protein